MEFREFIDSLKEPKLHFVNKSDITNTLFDKDITEPHYLISSSGTLRQKKYVFSLTKILESSKIIINHYNLDESDRWLLNLSSSHVAGFSIVVRSFLAKMNEPFSFKWMPSELESVIDENKITLMSLVPTQVFDLASYNIKAPKSIKAVFVGGARINKEIYSKAVALGWPLKICYGMTETFAQMSYSNDGGEVYKPYNLWSFKVDADGGFHVKGPSLFSYELDESGFKENKVDFFSTGDLCKIRGNGFLIVGRNDGLLKYKASFRDFDKIKANFEKTILDNRLQINDFAILALENLRNDVDVVIVSQNKDKSLKKLFSFLNVKGIFYLDEIPRTELDKLKKTSLSKLLKRQILFS